MKEGTFILSILLIIGLTNDSVDRRTEHELIINKLDSLQMQIDSVYAKSSQPLIIN